MSRNTKSIGIAYEDQFLKNAELEDCTLTGATIEDATLDGPILDGAVFPNADFVADVATESTHTLQVTSSTGVTYYLLATTVAP